MANQMFEYGRENFLAGNIDWDANNIKVVGVDHTDDTPAPATDDALDDILAGSRVATWGNLANKTNTKGVADADDVTATSVSGDGFDSLSIYKDSGVESTSYLFVFIDTATGLPCTPNGGDITLVWDSGTYKIFRL